MNLHLTYLETWQTCFVKFTQMVSLQAYQRTNLKNLLYQRIFFAGNFTLVRFYAGKVVGLRSRNFSLKQTKVACKLTILRTV